VATKFVQVRHTKNKRKDGSPVVARIPESAFAVKGGFKDKGWELVDAPKAATTEAKGGDK
jgi:hypothetical protein